MMADSTVKTSTIEASSTETKSSMITVEVAYALPEKQA
jgi:hypothetical protein